MIKLAHIFRRYGPPYREHFHGRILPSHLKAMQAIEQCRTEALGGHVFVCSGCGTTRFSYHSCRSRHCPTCQNEAAQTWLEKQKSFLLPVPYFLVTFTLPEQLRKHARSHQKTFYNLLFTSAAKALQTLAMDPRYLGAHIGMIAILHTWTRDMAYHPHLHCLVPAGGLSHDKASWIPAKYKNYLVPVKALSLIFRAIFRKNLRKHPTLMTQVPPDVWNRDWVVHSLPVGRGERALAYLAPYVYRVALTNNRLIKLEHDAVTFQFKDAKRKKWRTMTLPVFSFIHRFLQHVLPSGFVKIRYYGFLSLAQRATRNLIRYLLIQRTRPITKTAARTLLSSAKGKMSPPLSFTCPHCGGTMIMVQIIPRHPRGPP